MGDEAILVEYELHVEWDGKKRLITGRCVTKQNPGTELSKALMLLTGANLLTDDDQVCWVEFTRNLNGREIEFVVRPPTGFVVNG